MAMTVKRRKDTGVPRVIMHRVADIRGGVSVAVTELGGDYLPEGSVLSAPDNGICHVVKLARVVADVAADSKAISVSKSHNFNVGDFVMADEGGKAYAITAINTTNKAYDTIAVATALGAIAKGGFLIEAKAQATGTPAGENTAASLSELKYIPAAIVGTGKPVIQGDNLDTDAWVIAVTKGNPLPPSVEKHLKGIVNY